MFCETASFEPVYEVRHRSKGWLVWLILDEYGRPLRVAWSEGYDRVRLRKTLAGPVVGVLNDSGQGPCVPVPVLS